VVREERPDAVLIAGDVYDKSLPPVDAVQLLDDVLSRIILGESVPVVLIPGNHDSPERLSFGTRLLARQRLHVGTLPGGQCEPVIVSDDDGPVWIIPLAYCDPRVVRERLGDAEAQDHDHAMNSMVRWARGFAPPGVRTIAVAHAFVAGGEPSDSERPLSVGGAGSVDVGRFMAFGYTALGHLHRPQSMDRHRVRYAGSLMKYSFAEAGHSKSVTLVEMGRVGEVKVREVRLTPRRDLRCLEGRLADILRGPGPGESREDYISVTLTDEGALLHPMDRLREVYPNILEVRRSVLSDAGELIGIRGDHRRMSELELFRAFFEQVTGQPLTEEQEEVFAGVVEGLRAREEVAPS
jgi:exonuclease SbcD